MHLSAFFLLLLLTGSWPIERKKLSSILELIQFDRLLPAYRERKETAKHSSRSKCVAGASPTCPPYRDVTTEFCDVHSTHMTPALAFRKLHIYQEALFPTMIVDICYVHSTIPLPVSFTSKRSPLATRSCILLYNSQPLLASMER